MPSDDGRYRICFAARLDVLEWLHYKFEHFFGAMTQRDVDLVYRGSLRLCMLSGRLLLIMQKLVELRHLPAL